MDVVVEVQEDHEKLINEMQMYIDGTEIMFKAVDNDNIDKEMLHKGCSFQEKATILIPKTIERICKIFGI
ncbi:hypothetical protein [Clostridium akagii]|uniref:hypothetical protein n=1 Tax=Clostridium akagii TaxID=91623 RepID=UPI0004793236|nr:hypothetical protein [Clostridium akagii]